jgi:hypothetical protein
MKKEQESEDSEKIGENEESQKKVDKNSKACGELCFSINTFLLSPFIDE